MYTLKIFNKWLWTEALYNFDRRMAFFGTVILLTIVTGAILTLVLQNGVYLAIAFFFWVFLGLSWLGWLLLKLLRVGYLDFMRYYTEEREKAFNILKK